MHINSYKKFARAEQIKKYIWNTVFLESNSSNSSMYISQDFSIGRGQSIFQIDAIFMRANEALPDSVMVFFTDTEILHLRICKLRCDFRNEEMFL